MAIGALLQRNRQSGPGVAPERGLRSGGVRLVLHRERPGVATVRVIGAADERTEFAELEAEPACAANGAETRVGAGAVITEGKQFPEYSLIIGAPARVIRTLEPAQVEKMGDTARSYMRNGPRFKKGLKKIG